ncbi:uncharacterized protein HKW66_Vig0174710 [Vigna angularis]|uniref:Uncharacterized protein n=1 Tax=Phaseolus angularis TaxID=3914 RepID=A0A8T0JLW2_PHAAN|nr:uncharacterized protein HKW66_Vig0174710 [Vigna angularis]
MDLVQRIHYKRNGHVEGNLDRSSSYIHFSMATISFHMQSVKVNSTKPNSPTEEKQGKGHRENNNKASHALINFTADTTQSVPVNLALLALLKSNSVFAKE